MKKCPKFLYINIPSEELKSSSALKGRSGLEETVLYERIDDERLQDLPEDYEIKEIDTHRFPEGYFTYDEKNDIWKTVYVITFPIST